MCIVYSRQAQFALVADLVLFQSFHSYLMNTQCAISGCSWNCRPLEPKILDPYLADELPQAIWHLVSSSPASFPCRLPASGMAPDRTESRIRAGHLVGFVPWTRVGSENCRAAGGVEGWSYVIGRLRACRTFPAWITDGQEDGISTWKSSINLLQSISSLEHVRWKALAE